MFLRDSKNTKTLKIKCIVIFFLIYTLVNLGISSVKHLDINIKTEVLTMFILIHIINHLVYKKLSSIFLHI